MRTSTPVIYAQDHFEYHFGYSVGRVGKSRQLRGQHSAFKTLCLCKDMTKGKKYESANGCSGCSDHLVKSSQRLPNKAMSPAASHLPCSGARYFRGSGSAFCGILDTSDEVRLAKHHALVLLVCNLG